jgi:uncharacterized membrane protein HdeD (DUF308 family)
MSKSKRKWIEAFLGAVLLFGGGMCILVPAIEIQDCSLVITLVLGVTLAIQGIDYIWKATGNLRPRRSEKQLNKDKREQTGIETQ